MTKQIRTQWVADDGTELAYIDKNGSIFICCNITKSPRLLQELSEALEEASNLLLEHSKP